MLRAKRQSSLSTDLDEGGDLDWSPLPLSYTSEGESKIITVSSLRLSRRKRAIPIVSEGFPRASYGSPDWTGDI